jgi:hypothetical protein
MSIKGKVWIIPEPDSKTYRMVVHNEGGQTIGVTNNILPKNNPNLDQHDDHGAYGHGLLVAAGSVSWQQFHQGYVYHGTPIEEGAHLRVGIRGAAYKTVPLPAMKKGEIVELDLQDFIWYGHLNQNNFASMAGYAAQARNPLHANVSNKADVLSMVQALVIQKQKGVLIQGNASVEAIRNGNTLSHWEVKFENTGKSPFIGTVTFVGANKNDGMGLESMACPDKGSAAVQRIEAQGNYGKEAVPGAKVRVGVRGYAWGELELPAAGKVALDVQAMHVDSGQMADEFFDHALVTQKRQEKLARVQFFQDGAALNAEIKPVIYRGEEARQRADYDPPQVTVKRVKDSEDHPGGGWVVELTNKLPAQNADGQDVGFVATLKLGPEGWDPAKLRPKKFTEPGEAKQWFIPEGESFNGTEAQVGQELILGTRGLGWYVAVPLPAKSWSSEKSFEDWSYRDDQFHRHKLLRAFTDKCKD